METLACPEVLWGARAGRSVRAPGTSRTRVWRTGRCAQGCTKSTKSPTHAGWRQLGRRERTFPGQALVVDQPLGEPQFGVGGDGEPDPAVGLLGGAQGHFAGLANDADTAEMQLEQLMPPSFAAPAPVSVSVTSPLDPEAVLDQLRHAIDARRYSSPVRESAGYFRIGGDVSSSVVAPTFKPYFMPGLRAGYGAMTLELHGEIHATAEGSEIRANVFAPVRRPMVWALAILLVVSIAVSVAGSGDAFGWAFGVGGGSLVSAVWVRILRHNQRMALRNTDEFTRLVGSIVSTEPPVV